MNKYAEIAIRSIDKIKNKNLNPEAAWEESALEVFPSQSASRKKSCPKSAFLGLCENGLVKDVPEGNYTKSKDNKQYAIEALLLLKENQSLTEKELWERIEKIKPKTHNQQMNVVKILFENKYLK